MQAPRRIGGDLSGDLRALLAPTTVNLHPSGKARATRDLRAVNSESKGHSRSQSFGRKKGPLRAAKNLQRAWWAAGLVGGGKKARQRPKARPNSYRSQAREARRRAHSNRGHTDMSFPQLRTALAWDWERLDMHECCAQREKLGVHQGWRSFIKSREPPKHRSCVFTLQRYGQGLEEVLNAFPRSDAKPGRMQGA